jgi:hypothetical protein
LEMGEAAPVGDLNGSSGRSVDSDVLHPLGVERQDAWLTDCLSTYHLSVGMDAAIRDVYAPIARERGWPQAELPTHPSEQAIVGRAERDRLAEELTASQPEVIATLGEAARHVMADLLGQDSAQRLKPDDMYGSAVKVQVTGREAIWYPLVHPGQHLAPWRRAHNAWKVRVKAP